MWISYIFYLVAVEIIIELRDVGSLLLGVEAPVVEHPIFYLLFFNFDIQTNACIIILLTLIKSNIHINGSHLIGSILHRGHIGDFAS